MTLSERLLGGAKPFLAISSAALVALFVALVLINPEFASELHGTSQTFVARHLSEYLVWMVTIYLVFTLALVFTPFGRVRLGQDDERPEFSRFSWFAMLFSAGVGTGILFYGVAEPMFHLQDNPFLALSGASPMTPEGGDVALRVTLFHWGLHGWVVYSMVGLCLGYFSFRRGLPLTVSSALYPLLGERVHGPIGTLVDLVAVFSTLFGLAVSLGLGASQMGAGLQYLFGFSVTPATQLALILVVSSIATISAVSGVNRGIRRLSEMNIWLSAALIGFLVIAGPTLAIGWSFLHGTADYLVNFLPMGVWVAPDETERGWQGAWTLFYWGWWIAWGPFVGMFMARISRGRTLREYLFGTLLVPTVVGFGWLCVFGATALHLEFSAGGLVDAVNANMTQALFKAFEMLQVAWATWALALVATTLIISWFVTSCDSGTLVICTIITGGNTRPPKPLRIFWGTMIGLVAGLLLMFGGLRALQAASTAIAIPFALVLLAMAAGLGKALLQNER